jgi:hypothetical protein
VLAREEERARPEDAAAHRTERSDTEHERETRRLRCSTSISLLDP